MDLRIMVVTAVVLVVVPGVGGFLTPKYLVCVCRERPHNVLQERFDTRLLLFDVVIVYTSQLQVRSCHVSLDDNQPDLDINK